MAVGSSSRLVGGASSASRAMALGLSLCVLAGCGRGGPSSAGEGGEQRISLRGSDTMLVLGQRWAERYMNGRPNVLVQVSGGGSTTGIAGIINGITDICESSRPMSPQEKAELKARKGVDAEETEVAIDAVAVYVNPRNPVRQISLPALARVFEGVTTSWRDLGGADHPIVLYGREDNSGTYEYVREHVLGAGDFSPAVQALGGTGAVASAVKADEFGIGYGGIAHVEGVRALAVSRGDGSPAVVPSRETAWNGTYPVTRPLYFYTAGAPTPATGSFMSWVLGPDGQKTVSEAGYYPLPRPS